LNKALTLELDYYRQTYKASVIYLLDPEGNVFLSTNRDDVHSFLGHNYGFRPYFLQAITGENACYVALGRTSLRRGYYTAAPVRNEAGEIVAVITIKKDIEDLEEVFARYKNYYLSSESGIVFFSSEKENLYKVLPSCPYFDIRKLEQQFGITNCPGYLFDFITRDSDMIAYDSKEYMISSYVLAGRKWQLIHFIDMASLYRIALFFVLMTSFSILTVFVVALMIILLRTHRSIRKAVLSERWFRSMYEVAPEAILVSEKNTGRIIAANREGQKLFGFSEEQLKELNISRLVGKDKKPFSRLYVKNNQTRIARISQTDIFFQDIESSLFYIQDVTDEINRINELQNSEERYRLLAETLPETVFEINKYYRIEYINTAGKEIFGINGSMGNLTLDCLVPEDQRASLQDYINSVKPNLRSAWQEYSFITGKGDVFSGVLIIIPGPASEKQLRYRGLIIDITERKKAEYKIHRDEKLDSMGLLAGGLAHDFNNLLTVIKAGLSLLEFDNANDDLVETLAQMNTAVNRGTAITKQLLTFSPGGEPARKAVDTLLVIQELLTLVFSGTAIKIKLSIPDDIPPLQGDADQLSEVFQNLMLNARQAMNNRGVFGLSAIKLLLHQKNMYALPEGEYIEFHFTDNGKGIPPDKLVRIFDPFFTTKTNGSGLGLSVTYSIIRKHRGFIAVSSVPDKKTDFTVILPASSEDVAVLENMETELKKGSGRILLMDDDNVIRMVGKKLLERLGYTVVLAGNGEETVSLYSKAMKSGKFILVILDLTVPGGMGGKETLVKLKEIDPEVKAIVSSGYSVDPVLSSYREYGFCGMAIKPYDLSELSMIIHDVVFSPDKAGKTR
ncbi:MAG: PAS domain S-box protein, partial [Spirochaetales bacterium]|nr:PAS domain S-box protein [Spirochaetales bacterium]